MTPPSTSVWSSWNVDPLLVWPLALIFCVYVVGWARLVRRRPGRFTLTSLGYFSAGQLTIVAALCSPIDSLANLLLSAHMAQHVLLLMAAPPLLLLGEPYLPLLFGLPRPVRRKLVGPLLRHPTLRAFAGWWTRPVVGLAALTLSTWLWHIPAAYQAAIESPAWHAFEHATFLFVGMAFWWPVVEPYPARRTARPWRLLPHLLLADAQNTVLAAIFCFAERPIYPHYAAMPPLFGRAPLDDQALAGVIMWVPGSIAFLAPLGPILWRLLAGQAARPAVARETSRPASRDPRGVALPILNAKPHEPASRGFDLLRVPYLGATLRRRGTRTIARGFLLILALLVVIDGLCGPPVAAMNFAGVAPWIHWRGLVAIGLLAAGNVFCAACPFTFTRDLGRLLGRPTRLWPAWLEGKWLAVGLLTLFFWSYEAFGLWANPAATAAIVVGYFAAAAVVDGLFTGSSFCKSVCPIGQFHFVHSLCSPLDVRVVDRQVCHACVSKDCVRGNESGPGCAMGLMLPGKAGAMDCTLCLDCVRTCPSDNVALSTTWPGTEIVRDAKRAGIGRWTDRPDLAALLLLLTAAAYVNAAGMVVPVLLWRDRVAAAIGSSHLAMISMFAVAGLFVMPAMAAVAASAVGRWLGGVENSIGFIVRRFAPTLVPLSLAMWSAHYLFHFAASAGGVIPIMQRMLEDVGVRALGAPAWELAHCAPAGVGLVRLEILLLDVGVVGSLLAMDRVGRELSGSRRRGFFLASPWMAVAIGLFFLGVWMVCQPMEMRGALN